MTRRRTVALRERLLALRTEAELSQHDLSHLVGSNQSRISEWEKGKYRPSMTTLARYADVFNMTLSQLLDGVDLSEGSGTVTTNGHKRGPAR